MINPRKSLSYAVLGAACAADAYLRNDSKVAVYNFSDAPMEGRMCWIIRANGKRSTGSSVSISEGDGLRCRGSDPLVHGKKDLDLFIITDMKDH